MSNEAAERLGQHWDDMSDHERRVTAQQILAAGLLDALAAERKATVERIRAEALGVGYTHIENVDLFAILDAEEAR